MKHFLSSVVLVSTMALAGPAFAYGPAGCGVGHMIVGSDPGMGQLLAATTNGTFGNQTFGITSGTLGCDKAPGAAATAKRFIEANREVVAKDVAKGSGETIGALAQIAGCSDVLQVGATLQSSYPQIFPDAGVSDANVAATMIGVLRSDASLQCTALSTT